MSLAQLVSLRLLRLANPVVRAVLRSRLHPLLSRRLLVLTYHGRRTGRRFHIPLRYAETDDGRLVAVAVRPRRKLWWRTFREPAPAVVLLRGERVSVSGCVVRGTDYVSMLACYNRRSPRFAHAPAGAAVVLLSPTR